MPGEITEEKREFKFRYVIILILLLLFILSILSHNQADLAVLEHGSDEPIRNLIGPVGAKIARVLFYLFGLAIYPITLFLLFCLGRSFLRIPTRRKGYWGALAAIILGITILMAMWPQDMVQWTEPLGIGHSGAPELALSGGVIGAKLAAPGSEYLPAGLIRRHIGTVGTLIVAMTFLICGLVFVFLADWKDIFFSRFDFKISVRKKNAEDEEDAIPLRPAAALKTQAKLQRKEPYRPEPVPEEETDEEENPEELDPEDNGLPPFDPDPAEPAGHTAAVAEPQLPPPPPPQPKRTPPPATYSNFEGGTGHELQPRQHPDQPIPQPRITDAMNGSNQRSHITANQSQPTTGNAAHADYCLPPIKLFDAVQDAKTEDREHLARTQEILQATLDSFGIDGRVSDIVIGPRITRFDVSLEPGVKVEKVTSITNNIAMEMQAESVRILAPIPGKNAVGVEVPNKVSTNVYIRSIMEGEDWKKAKAGASNIPIILGRDVAGKAVIANLAKAPHLLIAGSTGSGKSVCMNTLIMSLLCKFSPYDLRLILVDPKFVELAMYRPLPHLITPVVNDPKLVPLALRWGVNEMERRYQILAAVKAKNLESFNNRPVPPEPELDEHGNVIPQKLPLLVVIIDELADIMMTEAKADVETSICRIAQKGRAAGIHLVIATQTPRKDIITGVIKANLPTKISFRVGSGIDSRVILDTVGAEKLLGKGDMLFLAPGGEGMERVQGSMVSDPEIQRVVDFVSAQVEQKFDSKVVAEAEIQEGEDEPPRKKGKNKYTVHNHMNGDEGSVYEMGGDEDDIDGGVSSEAVNSIAAKYLKPGDSDLMRKALEIIINERKASTSYLQRRLVIGYNRAAELMDQLEQRGIISAPLPGGQKRDILILDDLIETNEYQ